MNITRRTFAGSMAAAPFVVRAQQGPLRARIKIDTERTIGDIDPKIYGNFIEHLGRCIDGGVFEEGSRLADANGFRRDVLDAAKKLNVTLLRWPGGNFSSNYQWRGGIGPRDKRPPRLEMAWGTVESNRYGTHEVLQYAEMLGAQPYICCNLGTGSWVDAHQWVEYCNSAEDTEMTRLRRQNGCRDPWKVTYWGLGNEMDGPCQADEVDRSQREAHRRGIVQLPARLRLDRLESRGPRLPGNARRLSGDPLICRQSGERLRRLCRKLGGSERS